MKVRTDILRMYKEIHGWVGIVSGLALFIAFFAGAITMFEVPLQRWASPQTELAAPVPLERAPELIEAVVAAHPEAAKNYDIHVKTNSEQPARMSWMIRDRENPGAEPRIFYAALAPDGSLHVEEQGPSPVAQFVDVLHQHVGLPFRPEISRPVMGLISLLYAIAIVSGVIVLLPSLVSDLFATRVGKNVKRMWLDLHNLLGVLSLPFHLIMALTAVVFAFHDQFYDLQSATFARETAAPQTEAAAPPEPGNHGAPLAPVEMIRRVGEQAPGFQVMSINYQIEADGHAHVHVMGADPRYGLRAPTYGLAEADAYTGDFIEVDYMPGQQGNWGAVITSFFALHFGNFGGAGVRWSYFLLGMAGAFIFYTGNLLWIESRRKRERKAGAVEQSRSTRILSALTVGVPLGCVAGIAVTIAAAKPLGISASNDLHGAIYFAIFVAFTIWALVRGTPRAATELMPATALALLLVPAASLLYLDVFPMLVPLVDVMAIAAAAFTIFAWRSAIRRARSLPRDSVWSNAQGSANKPVAQLEGAG